MGPFTLPPGGLKDLKKQQYLYVFFGHGLSFSTAATSENKSKTSSLRAHPFHKLTQCEEILAPKNGVTPVQVAVGSAS